MNDGSTELHLMGSVDLARLLVKHSADGTV